MPVETDLIYRDRETIIAELAAAWQARVPDVVLTPDAIVRIWIEVMSQTVEGLFLANQLLHDDMFPQTANALALLRYGDLFGRPLKSGTKATGTVLLVGAGGVSVPLGTIVSAPTTADDALDFVTSATVLIPNPGDAVAPVVADAGAGTLAAGTYEYAITFLTAGGETELGAPSASVTIVVNRNINVTSIPIGGPGTTARSLYQRLDGGAWQKITSAAIIAALANNTATSVTVGTSTLGGAPPVESTAERITVAAESIEPGIEYNVLVGTITDVSTGVEGLTSVANFAAFTGGSDDEDIEDFRGKLLDYVRSPQSGSLTDLEGWAEAVSGVEDATAINNDNVGVAAAGHVTVRIAGPNGAVPSADVIAATLVELNLRDIASITLHVATFTPKSTNVTVTITLQAGYVLAEVSPAVQLEITNYINDIAVGGTVYVAGIYHAVFGLPGVATVVVNVPAADVASTAVEKPVPGTITVN